MPAVSADAAFPFFAAASAAFSASGSYPSFSMRSASSRALRSAASKSKPLSVGASFLAPSLVFFAPRMFVLRGAAPVVVFLIADEDVVREAGGAAGVDSGPPESGDLGRAMPLPFAGALRKGDAVREPLRGVPVREGGFEGRLMVGLSQEEKKSSSVSPGVLVPSPESVSGMSVITTSSGYLVGVRYDDISYAMKACINWVMGCILFCIYCYPPRELLLVFRSGVRGIFRFRIFTS